MAVWENLLVQLAHGERRAQQRGLLGAQRPHEHVEHPIERVHSGSASGAIYTQATLRPLSREPLLI